MADRNELIATVRRALADELTNQVYYTLILNDPDEMTVDGEVHLTELAEAVVDALSQQQPVIHHHGDQANG